MKVSSALCTGLVLSSVLFFSGCWDRTEVNDLAFVMASSVDQTKNGKLMASVQIAVPSQLSGGQSGTGATAGDPSKTFVVESAVGRDLHDIEQKIQERLSRRLYVAHRRVLLIGENLAKHGIKDILDQFSRDPASRLRTYILVTKGMEGREILKIPSPLERVPAEAIRETERSGIGTEVTIRDVLMATSSEGIDPSMGALEMIKTTEKNVGQDKIRLADTAIFKNYKLVGYLNDPETRGLLWVIGKLEKGIITAYVKEGSGNVSLNVTQADRHIKTSVQGKKVKINVTVHCEGVIHENNTTLDLSRTVNIKRVEQALERDLRKRIQSTLNKAQKEYKADIFGFGQEIHRHHPSDWKRLKDKWNTIYPQADIQLNVDLSVLRSGMSGPPLQLPDDQVKRQ